MKKVFNQTCGKWFDTCGKRKTYLTRLQAGGLIFVATEKGLIKVVASGLIVVATEKKFDQT